MFGSIPIHVADNFAVSVRNLSDAKKWYTGKLGLREMRTDRQDDSGLPFVDLHFSGDDTFITLVEAGPEAQPQHAIFFTKNLSKAHKWLAERNVPTEPLATDSGGNRFFVFRDLDGNSIEVCLEPA
jgi:catechol 2,3-dioxygenase-like lactoylglutathione lyase family enzyme